MTKWLLCYANCVPIRHRCQFGICRYTNRRSDHPNVLKLRFKATLQQIPGSVGLSRPTWLGTLGVGKGREHRLVMMAWSDPKLEAKHVSTSNCPNHCIQSDDQRNIFYILYNVNHTDGVKRFCIRQALWNTCHLMKFGSGYRSITGEVWVSEASGRDGRKGWIEMGIYIDIIH